MKLLAVILPIVASVAIAQQRHGMHYSISEAVVAKLLRANGVNVASSQVHLPMQLTAASAEPQLEIAATRRVTEYELDLEVHCQVTTECLPFDALVDVSDANTVIAEVQRDHSLDTAARQSSADKRTENPSPAADSIAATSDHLRVGSHAVLVIVDGRMRIHLPVIAMDSGAKGTLIRVCTVDRKKIFRALVVDGGTVQGVAE